MSNTNSSVPSRFLTMKKPNTELPNFLGLDKLINKKNNVYQKCVWCLALIVSFVLTAWQVTLCLAKYLDEPIGTEISVVFFNTFSFPSITMCPTSKYLGYDFDEPFKKVCDKDSICRTLNSSERIKHPFDKLEISLLALWMEKKVQLSLDVKCEYALNSSECNEISTSDLVYQNTIAGMCQTFNNIESIKWHYTGKTIWPLILKEVTTGNMEYLIQTSVHPTPVVETLFVGYQVMKRDVTNRLEMDFTEFQFLNSSKHPCENPEDSFECQNKCFEKKLLSVKPNCRWPFLNSDLPWCNTMAEIEHFRKQIIEVQKLIPHCKCRRPCLLIYAVSSITHSHKTNSTLIAPVLNTDKKQVVKEFYIYKLTSCVSDLGGNIGIFLGISLLSCFEFFYSLTEKVARKIRK